MELNVKGDVFRREGGGFGKWNYESLDKYVSDTNE
jgi:hypothetical protein